MTYEELMKAYALRVEKLKILVGAVQQTTPCDSDEIPLWALDVLGFATDNQASLPDTYAEVEYSDFDDAEAIEGSKWDDMNYLYYTER